MQTMAAGYVFVGVGKLVEGRRFERPEEMDKIRGNERAVG